MSQKRMILCLGPHRSGTSTVTAALGMLGAELALPAVYANDENARGFFEQPEVLAFDERLLAALGGAWDAPAFDCAAALAASAEAAALKAEAVSLIRRLFGAADVAAMKDPRQCLLLPFWVPVLAEAGFDDLVFVHVLRDPVEVAQSQRTRAEHNPEYYEIGRELAEGAALWLSHSCQMWQEFRAAQHVMIGYDRLLDQPGPVLALLAEALALTPDPEALVRFQSGFLDPTLRRSRVSKADRAEVEAALPQAMQAFALMAPLADTRRLTRDDVEPLLSLWTAKATQNAIARIMAPVPARLSRRHRDANLRLAEMTGHLAEAERSIDAQRAETLRVAAAMQAEMAAQLTQQMAALARTYESSTSWKVTAPLRAAGSLVSRARTGLPRVWIGVNHLARAFYRGLAQRAPRTAEVLRRVAGPMLHLGNRLILRRHFVPAKGYRGSGSGGDPMVYQQPRPMQGFAPLVTVLVPNFNHAAYLRQRLDSIFAQTYANIEVILLDDCSTDDSRAVLTEYAKHHADRARVIFNDANSGGAFFQWEKGLREAKGDLIWIAESDDWCDANFLEALVPYFANASVQMAYAPSAFMNQDGSSQVWSMAEYLAEVGAARWAEPFVLPAPVIVREAFAAKNIIPNVSSAVFRRPDRLDVLENAVWRGMRTSGDWVFYLNLIRGGCLAYSPATRNYFRQHPANTSRGSFTQDRYYAEHMEVACAVQRHYRVDPAIFAEQRQALMAHWVRNRGRLDAAAFDACYDLARIGAEAAMRKPNLLMACYAFIAGGGETFPIALANLMKTAGYNVTFLNCDQEPAQQGIRDQLARDVPVVSDFGALEAIVRDFDIDVIHSHHAWVDNTLLDILPEDTPARTVITLHGMYETIPEPQLKRMLPRLVRRTARMVYIADKNTEAMVEKGGLPRGEMTRIDNALPRGAGQAVPRGDLGIPEGAFVLTVVSRGIPEKGWDEAIRAVTRARALSGADIHLVVVGDGPELVRLSGRAPGFVHMVGFRANTRDYFAMADLGLLPSRFKGESFPLVLIDCLNAGRPMLATDLGEVRAMLASPDGLAGEAIALSHWQIPVETLAQRIAALARDPQAMAAMAARVPAAAAKFDPDRMRDAYDAVYVQTAGKGARDAAT